MRQPDRCRQGGGNAQIRGGRRGVEQSVARNADLAHALVLACEVVLVWIAVGFMFHPPAVEITFATVMGVAFALLLNLSAGNLLSIYSPKKRDFATLGRQNVSQTTVLVSLGLQIVIVGVGVAAFAVARFYKNLWIAALLFLVLAAISIPVYVIVLRRIDGIAIQRRETLLAELCRA